METLTIKKKQQFRGVALSKKLLESKKSTLLEMEARYQNDEAVAAVLEELRTKNDQKRTNRQL